METKKNDEAKRVFEQLIREYPEIADSYNNLAVIYAGEGNLGRAQDLLELATGLLLQGLAHPSRLIPTSVIFTLLKLPICMPRRHVWHPRTDV